MRRIVAWVLILVLGSGAAGWEGRFLYDRAGPLTAPVEVVVPRGSLGIVADKLRAAGVVDSALALHAAALATYRNGPVHAAELAFPAHASLRTVLAVLREGRPVEHDVTIPEGMTAAEIAVILARAGALTGPVTVPPEGAVLPQTYAYERGTTREALLRRMRTAMQATLGAVWRQRDGDLGLQSPWSLLVLASMVERETGLAPERATVARVFLNRLRLGMKLQSDPTAAYQATGGLGSLTRPLTRADLALPGATNTYVLPGLPSAPICSPGLAALEAVAHPASTDALYFVARRSGGHVFAASLPEQTRNVERYKEDSEAVTLAKPWGTTAGVRGPRPTTR